MGLKLRWFRARMNFASRPKTTDFSAPTHGLYRPTYSVYEADTFAMSRSTRDVSRPGTTNTKTTLPSKQMSRSMPDLVDTPSPQVAASVPKVRSPQVQHNPPSLHNPQASREVAAAMNPAFAQYMHDDSSSQETAKTRNRLQLKISIPPAAGNHVLSEPVAAVNPSMQAKNRYKNKLAAPQPPKLPADKKDKKSKKVDKEVIDLRFGGESES